MLKANREKFWFEVCTALHKKHRIGAPNILNSNFYICLLSAQITFNLAISVTSQIKKNKQGVSQREVLFWIGCCRTTRWWLNGNMCYWIPCTFVHGTVDQGMKREKQRRSRRIQEQILGQQILPLKYNSPGSLTWKQMVEGLTFGTFLAWTPHRVECIRSIQVLMSTSPGSGDAGAEAGQTGPGGGPLSVIIVTVKAQNSHLSFSC